jgi:HSP20 family protein
MSTLHQLRDGLTRAWETVTEGWRELVERAGDALTRFHPSSAGGELQTREERIAYHGSRWGVLAAEVKLLDDHVEVDIEVPGMESEDFDIQVADDVLVVRGEKRVERERKDGRYHVMERAYGAFERAVRLPVAVDESGARARYRRGVLHISLPRSEAHRTRRIEVQVR